MRAPLRNSGSGSRSGSRKSKGTGTSTGSGTSTSRSTSYNSSSSSSNDDDDYVELTDSLGRPAAARAAWRRELEWRAANNNKRRDIAARRLCASCVRVINFTPGAMSVCLLACLLQAFALLCFALLCLASASASASAFASASDEDALCACVASQFVT